MNALTLAQSIVQLILVDELVVTSYLDDGISTFIVESQFAELLVLGAHSLFEVHYNVTVFLELIGWFSYHLVIGI